VAGAELGDRAAVLGLGGELAYRAATAGVIGRSPRRLRRGRWPVGDGRPRGVGGEEHGDGKPVDRAWVAAGGVVEERGVVAEQRVRAAGLPPSHVAAVRNATATALNASWPHLVLSSTT
jgi:hypothetical protein